MKLDINMSIIWTMLGGTAVSVAWIFTSFASADRVSALELEHEDFVTSAEFQKYVTSELFDSYYAMLERWNDAIEKGNEYLAREYSKRLEQL